MQSAKCVFVGDSGTGKSYLLSTYIRKSFPGEYHTDFLDRYSAEVKIKNQIVQLHVLDTAGSEDYARLRLLVYPHTNVVVICFSISDPLSYQSVTQTWLPDVEPNCPKAPILLVGTKSDLRDNKEILEKLNEKRLSTITQQQGLALAKKIRAAGYFECSSIHQEGLDEIFEKAAQIYLQRIKRTPSKKHCIIL
ncbi:ras-related C3 botulinum toxin substrate 2-like [Boleophthalmus pectinirostris]|uniref:ras-related C3 botulinum toxin substrate 2-like n=1 Tax=Boleophthalmus pectinirostris TaxID=150288 RepID=UPI00242D5044|nr:ras-related C3 botulinum toxin substrate 2-like [Boleophthalmus pectinirostris]